MTDRAAPSSTPNPPKSFTENIGFSRPIMGDFGDFGVAPTLTLASARLAC